MNQNILRKLETLPSVPGVYKFYDKDKNLLYIGKAINLRNRVRSYFAKDIYDRPRIVQMVPLIEDFEVTEVNNEIEALVLESALIKKFKPKFNSDLKDDKTYAWIYVSTKDEYPTVKIVRTVNPKEFRRGELFGPYPSGYTVKRVFTYLRKLYPFCTCKKDSDKECLYYHLGLCPGPYQGHISKEDYRKNINEIVKFLRGRKKGQIVEYEKEMRKYSRKNEYEKAAILRDKINDLRYLGEKIDFTYFDTEDDYKGKRKKSLERNFDELRTELNLNKLHRIECYDISNIQGKGAYGSMTVAIEGELRREEYRIFKIKSIDTPNDPKMLKEVLSRRFSDKDFKDLPEIVLIDGGKSQLSVLKDIIPKNILLIGISKGKRLKRRGAKLLDEFWGFSEDTVVALDIVNAKILINLRDEAHRFAISHHRRFMIKNSKRSKLEKIVGIGEVRRKELLKKFKDIDGIKKASDNEILDIVKNKVVLNRIRKEL